jgi:bifunctional DNA primase/polymerase-like protein/primase-like protein
MSRPPRGGATNGRLASALEFAQIGCRIVVVAGKDPGRFLGAGWQHQATRDEDVLAGWWRQWPSGNLGIVPDRALVPVDVDDPGSFERLQAETCPAPPTPRYLTGGAPGRERLLFAYDDRLEHADRQLADGAQLRHCDPGKALMSVVPPGINPDSGVELEWTIALDEVPLAQIPEPWLTRVLPGGSEPVRRRPASEWVGLLQGVPERGGPLDGRNNALAALAGHWLGHGLHPGEVLELAVMWNERCTPPQPTADVVRTVGSIARKDGWS